MAAARRSKTSHILPSPLPVPMASYPPLRVLRWESPPNRVVARTCQRSEQYFLQATALSDNGVEVQELPLTFLHGNGKAREETVVVQAEVGPGGAGFLCRGGHWAAGEAGQSGSPIDMGEEGFYAWTQKGYHDWRVFWLGGDC